MFKASCAEDLKAKQNIDDDDDTVQDAKLENLKTKLLESYLESRLDSSEEDSRYLLIENI